MGLEERLVDEMKQAMRSSDKVRLSTIRMIRTAVKNKEIELRKKLDDEEIQRVIQGMLPAAITRSQSVLGKLSVKLTYHMMTASLRPIFDS